MQGRRLCRRGRARDAGAAAAGAVSPWRCSRLRAGTRDCGRRHCRRCPLVAVATAPLTEAAVRELDALPVTCSLRAPPARLAAGRRRVADPLAPPHLRAGLIRRQTCPQPGLLSARQHTCAMHVRHRLHRRPAAPPPSAIRFWPLPHPEHRRTQRSCGRKRHGFAQRGAARICAARGGADSRSAGRRGCARRRRRRAARSSGASRRRRRRRRKAWDPIDFAIPAAGPGSKPPRAAAASLP